MPPLPDADPETRAWFVAWLDGFSARVRAIDYAGAKPSFHPDIIAFGTHRDLVSGIDHWIDNQWSNVWPCTDDFRFVTDQVRVLAAADRSLVTVIAPWTSTGFSPDGAPFDRPGRATMIFSADGRGGWLGVHSHMSLNRGVPQESFAQRTPVPAGAGVIAG